MRKVRIKTLPTAQSGLDVKMGTSGRGMQAGLGLNSNTMPWPVMAGQMAQPDTEVNKTLKPVAREGANLEAEKGETAFTDLVGDGIPQLYKIGGERHYAGGTPLNLPEDSFIYSRDKKMKIGGPILESFGKHKDTKDKFTPADLSNQYQINDFRKALADPDTDKLQRETAEMMIANYNLKLGKLGLVQESKKGFPDGIPAIAMPYLETMQVDPTQFMMQNPQGQGPQGMPDQPAADNVAKYGITVAQNGKTVTKYNTEEEYKKHLRDPWSKEKEAAQIEWNKEAIKQKRFDDISASLSPETKAANKKILEHQYNIAQFKLHPESTPDPYTGYWDRTENNNLMSRGFFGDAPGFTPDPRVDEAFRKIWPGNLTEKSIPGKTLEWATNIASMPQKELNYLMTNLYETPGQTVKRSNPNLDSGTELLIDVATDPFIMRSASKAVIEGVASGVKDLTYGTVKKSLPYVKTAAIATADFAKKYGPKVADKIVAGLKKVGLEITKENLERVAQTLPQIVSHFHREETPESLSSVYYAPELYNPSETVNQVATPKVQQAAAAPQAQFVQGKVQAIVPPGMVTDTAVAPAKALTPEQEYEAYMKANPPKKKKLGGDIQKFDGGGSYTTNGPYITYEDGSVMNSKNSTWVKHANPEWGKSTTKPSTKPSAKADPMMGTYTPSVMEALRKKEAEGYEIFAPKTKSTGKEREVLQHQQKKVHNVYGEVDWSPEQQADFKERHGWVYEQKPDFNPTDETVVGTWPKGTKRNGKDVSGQPMTKGQQDTYWFQQEAEKNVPGYFNQGVAGTEFDALMGEHTFSVPGWKKKEAKPGEPTPVVTKQGERIKQAVLGPDYKTPGPEWWLQDKIRTAGAFGDLMGIKKYNPWQATPGVAYGERTFFDPTRELAANAEQVNLGVQGASTYSGPQSFAATAAFLQGQGAKNAANTMASYNNLNVNASNALSDMNTDIFNRASQQRAANATQLFDKQTIVNQQFDNSKNLARQNLRQGFMDAITNRANTYNLNTLYPQFAVAPGSGGMAYNIPGSNRKLNSKYQDQQDAIEGMKAIHNIQGLSDTEKLHIYDNMYGKGNKAASNDSQGYEAYQGKVS